MIKEELVIQFCEEHQLNKELVFLLILEHLLKLDFEKFINTFDKIEKIRAERSIFELDKDGNKILKPLRVTKDISYSTFFNKVRKSSIPLMIENKGVYYDLFTKQNKEEEAYINFKNKVIEKGFNFDIDKLIESLELYYEKATFKKQLGNLLNSDNLLLFYLEDKEKQTKMVSTVKIHEF